MPTRDPFERIADRIIAATTVHLVIASTVVIVLVTLMMLA
jgi:hypothetical protein